MKESVQKGLLALILLCIVAALGVYIIGLPMIPNPEKEGFDARSKSALKDCEGKYQDCINQGGNPVDCTGRYNTCSSVAASKNPLVNRGDTSTPTGDRDKQLSAPAALQKSGKIWAPNYTGLYQGLAAESRAPSEPEKEASWYDKVVGFFFGTGPKIDGFASYAPYQKCEKDFTACLRSGGKSTDCKTIYDKCIADAQVQRTKENKASCEDSKTKCLADAENSKEEEKEGKRKECNRIYDICIANVNPVNTNVQTTSTSPIRDASGNLVKYAGRDYSQNDINNPYYFNLANTSNPFSRELNAGDYAALQKYALAGAGGDTSSSKAFLASIAAKVASDQGVTRATDAQLAAAQGGDQEEIPDAATYTPSTTSPLAPHQTPGKIQVQLKPEIASYLTNPSLRANVRQETKNAIADALASVDNEYEIKYVYA